MLITCDHALMLAIVDILRKFNPGLYGGSPGGTVSDSRGSMQAPSSQLVVSQCKAQQPCDNRLFNGAVTGAVANDIPGQLANLTKVLQADPNIDFENDWKVITLWIGGNDLCRYGTVCDALKPRLMPWLFDHGAAHATTSRSTNLPRTLPRSRRLWISSWQLYVET